MYPFMIRRIIPIRNPLNSLGSFTQTPLKSLRLLSSSSEIVSNPSELVTVFFENHGFSKSQISTIIKKLPNLLSAKPEKSLLPKLLFFQSKGLSSPEVAKLVTGYPYILTRSLDNHIIPSFDYVQDLLQSEEKTIGALKRYLGILDVDLRNSVCPNIEILREIGVPQTTIANILRLQPRLFSLKSHRFKETVDEAKEMGFKPQSFTFVFAVAALRSMSKSTWKKKIDVYRKWGWSEEDVLSAFGRHPACMMASEEKINGVVDYFFNKIGCESSFLTKNPALLCYSLNRRIIPRGYVYLVLSAKGLIKKHVTFGIFNLTEKGFLDKYIKPNEKHIPGLLKLYEKELKVSESKVV